MKKLIVLVLTLVFLTCLVLVGDAIRFLNLAPSTNNTTVIFDVAPGENLRTITSHLFKEGLITNETRFLIFSRFARQEGNVRVGEYSLRPDMRPGEVLSVITSGHSIERSLTIQEGLNIYEIADIFESKGLMARNDFLLFVKNPANVKELLREDLPSLEGYLFPETYFYTKFTPAKSIIKMMVDKFQAAYAKIPPPVGFTRHQHVTLASIIEKETGAPEERTIISSVFHNRLTKKIRLETDPTVLYGILDGGRITQNITREDLQTPTRYNTYRMEGLPFGPISNPGAKALEAAARPASTEYLFFVSRNDGTHVFSRNYQEHLKAVTDYQLNRNAGEGKSWRDQKARPTEEIEKRSMELQKAPPPKRP